MSWTELFFPKPIIPEHNERLARVRDALGNCANILQTELPEGRYKDAVRIDLEKLGALSTKAFTHNDV